jgi:RNA polymerase sigma factor (sigma-70 family)
MVISHLRTIVSHIHHLAGVSDTHELTDRQLLQRFADRRDEAAFAALVRRHGALVFGVCRRTLGNLQDAEDAFQATFLVLARKAGAVAWHESVGGWLHEVASRLAAEVKGKDRRRRRGERQAGLLRPREVAPEAAVSEVGRVLDDELQRMPRKYREPLLLCYLEGRTRDETARQLGCPLGTLKHRLERGRELLRARLTRRGVSLSAVLLAVQLSPKAAHAVAPEVVAATARAGVAFAAGGGDAVAPAAAALAKRLLADALPSKLKVAVGMLLVVAVAGAGLGMALRSPPTVAEPQPQQEEKPQPRGEARPPARPVDRWQVRATFGQLQGPVCSVAFSPDGTILAAGCGAAPGSPGQTKLWDTATGAEIFTLRGHARWVRAVAFSPDGKVLATGGADAVVKLWDTGTWKEIGTLEGHRGEVRCLAFSPDGKRLASGSQDKSVKVWDWLAGRELLTFTGNRELVIAVAFSPDGKMLASGTWTVIKMWDPATGREGTTLKVPGPAVSRLAFSPDGKTLASAGGQVVKLWEVVTGQERATLRGHTDLVTTIVFSPDGKRAVSGDEGGGLRVWEKAMGRELAVLPGHKKAIEGLAFSPEGTRLASGGMDETVRLWDVPGLPEDRPPTEPLSPREAEDVWGLLANTDVARAYQAMARLEGAPNQAVRLCREHLQPVPTADPQRIAGLLTDLDSERFAVREAAAQTLEKAGEAVVPALRQALPGQSSGEVRRRIELLLDKLDGWSPDRLQAARALEVLEHVGTPASRRVLEELAKGAPEAWRTQEAKAAVERLDRQSAGRP